MHWSSTTKTFAKRRKPNRPLRPPIFSCALLLSALLLFQVRVAEAVHDSFRNDGYLAYYPPTIDTFVYRLRLVAAELEKFNGSGGAIEPLGNGLLLATARGRIAFIDIDGGVTYLPQEIPMNDSAAPKPIHWAGFRVADILLHEVRPGSFRLFASHHYYAGACVEFRVSSISLDYDHRGAMISGDWKTEYSAPPCIKNVIFGRWEGETSNIGGGIQVGGRMLMDGAEHLLLSVGDHGWYEWHERQEPGESPKVPAMESGSHLGKLVRIELASGDAKIFASGFRNAQGLARDEDGNIWQTEHGPLGGDELNLVMEGLDYGWPFVTYGIQYGYKVWPFSEEQSQHKGFEEPVFTWVPSIAASSLVVSDSQQFPLWKDDFLIATLRKMSIYRVRLREQRVTFVEKIEIGERIRDMTQMKDGSIALLAAPAKIIILRRDPIYCHDSYSAESIYSYDADKVCFDISTITEHAESPEIQFLQAEEFDDPIIRSFFNVYIHKDQLIYLKAPCTETDLSHRFHLHIAPVDPNHLAEDHKEHGINNLDFSVGQHNVKVASTDGGCIVARPLPHYEIARISTGQVTQKENKEGNLYYAPFWNEEKVLVDIGPADISVKEESDESRKNVPALSDEEIADLIAKSDNLIVRSFADVDLGDPVIRSQFTIYRHKRWLLYAKANCSQDEISARFFLHITPADRELTSGELGFDVYDFNASEPRIGFTFNQKGCVVARALPSYEIEMLHTGQVIREVGADGEITWKGPVWEGSYTIGGPLPAPALPNNASSPIRDGNFDNHFGATLFAAKCASCHNLTSEHHIGPHLKYVIGRRAGNVDGFNSSDAITDLNISWTRENLARFIIDPDAFAPGTTMGGLTMTEDEARLIADFLASQR